MKRACLLAISMTVGLFACDKEGDLGDTGNTPMSGGGEGEGGEAEGEDGEADDGGESDPGMSSTGGEDEGTTSGAQGSSGAMQPDVGTGDGEPSASCDPLLQDCNAGEVCVYLDDGFQCLDDQSGPLGASGDACEAVNDCNAGLMCAIGAAVECPGGLQTCCTHFCDVAGPMCPSGECMPFFEDGAAPPGYENVGACTGT
jgi:hypothetical protein